MQEVLEEGVTARAEEVGIIEGGQNDPRKLEEELEKLQDHLNRVMEELHSALALIKIHSLVASVPFSHPPSPGVPARD